MTEHVGQRAATTTAKLFEFPAAPRVRHNLPPTTVRMVGRDAVVDQLVQDVRQSRLVSIVGAGGMGKTTVALGVAERALETFSDGVWFVDLAPLRDPSLIPHAIASAAGLVVHSGKVLPALARFLQRGKVLLVLDNCEHMITAVACCVEQLLQQAPEVHFMTTSRYALHVEGEQEHKLQGLASPSVSTGLTTERALSYPAVELFVARASDRLVSFVLDDADAPAVADICRSLDGIALAIELAAMRVDVFGVKELKEQLSVRLRLLAGRRAGLERHRTLTATLDWSYRLLPDNEARLLRAVSVFAGGFRLGGAAALAQLAPELAGTMLADLASKSLLSVDTTPSGGDTYRLLATTRLHCADMLSELGEDETVRQRHAEYVCIELEQAAEEWEQQRSRDWGATYRSYLDDLRDALAWTDADSSRHPLLVRLTTAGILLWNHFSLTDESRLHLGRAIARLRALGAESSNVEMHLQFALAGAVLYTRGVIPEARSALRRALHLSEYLKDGEFLLRCLRLTATFELFSGEHEAGLRTLETFLAIAKVEDPSALPEGETHLSCGEVFVGQLQSARQRMELLAGYSQDFNDARFVRFQYSNSVNILIVLCHAQWLTGSPDAALRSAQSIIQYGHHSAHELSLSIALAWNCLAHLWMGRDDECSEQAAMLDELVEQHGIVTWRPVATFCRSAIAARRQPGSFDGVDGIRRAIEEFRSIGHMARLPYYIAVLAEVLGQRACFQEAEAAIQEAVALAAHQNERWCAPEILRIQAVIACAQGRFGEAEPLLERAIQMARVLGALSWELRASCDLASLWKAQSRGEEALAMLAAVHGAFSEGFETRDLVAAAKLLAELA